MATNNRPLSPHLQVYRLPLTGLVSITHRMTGVLLCVGLIGLVGTLVAIVLGENYYNAVQQLSGLLLVKLIYWGFVYALSFHLCHGIRHLLWDAGSGLDRATLNTYAVYELIAAAVLWLLAFYIY